MSSAGAARKSRVMDDLVAGKFKFTSRKGRERRVKLLEAAKALLETKSPQDVSFADVCERARIPRPSAYHFFPDIQSVFLGVRLMHAEALVAALGSVERVRGDSWSRYFGRLVDAGVKVMRADRAATRLIYGGLGGWLEVKELGKALDARLAQLALEGLERRFELPSWPNREAVMAVAFTIVDSILRLSFRTNEELNEWMVDEAKRGAVSYLKNYLPEVLPVKERT